ncbi:MAG TPA: hypothetical protein VEW69_08975 [Alphaproteobacteria bacterium]|nr:hypothetical protein [Alphaproteobacteria bacterium]
METSAQSPGVRQPVSTWPLWVCLAAWAVAFFLPAYAQKGNPQIMIGWKAAALSAIAYMIPIYGQAWPANLFMLLAPFLRNRAQRGKGKVYFTLFAVAAIEPLGIPFHPASMNESSVERLLVGYYVWQIAILGAAAWYGWTLFRPPTTRSG